MFPIGYMQRAMPKIPDSFANCIANPSQTQLSQLPAISVAASAPLARRKLRSGYAQTFTAQHFFTFAHV